MYCNLLLLISLKTVTTLGILPLDMSLVSPLDVIPETAGVSTVTSILRTVKFPQSGETGDRTRQRGTRPDHRTPVGERSLCAWHRLHGPRRRDDDVITDCVDGVLWGTHTDSDYLKSLHPESRLPMFENKFIH